MKRSDEEKIFGPMPKRKRIPYEMMEPPRDIDDRGEDGGRPSIFKKGKPIYLPGWPVYRVGTMDIDQADELLVTDEIWDNIRAFRDLDYVDVLIGYPLSNEVMIRIYPMARTPAYEGAETTMVMSVGYILWQVALAYRQIYTEDANGTGPWDWGVWGHTLTDLVFEGIEIFDDNFCVVLIGS